MPIINVEDPSLHNDQKQALIFSLKSSKEQHEKLLPNVVQRFINNNLTTDDMIDAVNYVRNLPIIVHFGVSTFYKNGINWLKTENKYKSIFETSHDGLCQHDSNNVKEYCRYRAHWENNLFNLNYNNSANDHRVKYGCLNLMLDHKGCRSALSYGQAFLILKPVLKSRVTFTFGDSVSNPPICTFDNFIHIFSKMEMRTVFDIVRMAKSCLNQQTTIPNIGNMYTYLEAQIHGDIVLNKDVQKIMLN